MTKYMEQRIAEILLSIGAISLSPAVPFTWASGLRTPIYCDNRLIMSHPVARREVVDALVAKIREHYPDVEIIAGTATAGIPHAAFVAQQMDLPMIYVRSGAKDHGKGNQIEGLLQLGQKVVMIEDLISTGGSVIQAAKAVESAGGQVMGCLAIFNYLLARGKQAFEEAGYALETLTNYQALVEVAVQLPELAPYRQILSEWYQDPKAWSDQHG